MWRAAQGPAFNRSPKNANLKHPPAPSTNRTGGGKESPQASILCVGQRKIDLVSRIERAIVSIRDQVRSYLLQATL